MRNRKKTLQVTVEEMRNFSFAYIERYAPSKQQLRTYLLKKYLKANLENIKKQDITDLIDVVLQDLEKTKFINDKFYSESKSRSLIQRGSSVNKIRNYLITRKELGLPLDPIIKHFKRQKPDYDSSPDLEYVEALDIPVYLPEKETPVLKDIKI